MVTDSRQILQWVAGGLLTLLGVAALIVYVYDSINGHAVDSATNTLIALVIGVISSVFSFNVGANSTANATAQANQNTAAVVAAANGTAGPVAKAHLGVTDAPAPATPATAPDMPTASDNAGNGGA